MLDGEKNRVGLASKQVAAGGVDPVPQLPEEEDMIAL